MAERYEFKFDDAYQHACDFFIQSNGLNSTQKRKQRMRNDAFALLDTVKGSIRLQALSAEFPGSVYTDSGVCIGDLSISCNAFKEIKSNDVKKVFVTMITAGDWASSGKLSHMVYLDSWGTAFVDSAKILLEQELKKRVRQDLNLSNPFGPGYYGMPTQDTLKIASILNSGIIGISVKDSGIMVPEKTIAAIYLVTKQDALLPPVSCSECFGSSKGCKTCDKYFKT